MLSSRTASAAALLALGCLFASPPCAAETDLPATSMPSPAPPAPFPAPGPADAAVSVPTQSKAADPFGEAVTLPQRRIVYLKGEANWDSAFDTLIDAYRSVYGYLAKEGLAPAGPAMTIYTQADDSGFHYQAAVPIAQNPKQPPQGDVELGTAPSGKALKFVHRGSYDAMDSTYEAITNYLDEKRIDAGEVFIEEYETDILKTPEDKLVISVFVPVK